MITIKSKLWVKQQKQQETILSGYNVIYHHPETKKGKSGSIGFWQAENLKFENSTEETMHEVLSINYNDTKLAELKSWKQNNVYHEVSYEGQDLISLRWVCSLKQ